MRHRVWGRNGGRKVSREEEGTATRYLFAFMFCKVKVVVFLNCTFSCFSEHVCLPPGNGNWQKIIIKIITQTGARQRPQLNTDLSIFTSETMRCAVGSQAVLTANSKRQVLSPPVKSMPGNPGTGIRKDCSGLRIDKVPIPEVVCLLSGECTLRNRFVSS